MTSEYRRDIEGVANALGLSARVIEGVVLTESGDSQWAYNPEPKYRYFWNVRTNKPFRAVTEAEVAGKVPPADFPSIAGDRDQEWWAQQASWGLMQIMGAVAREHGYMRPYLTSLCQPSINLIYGAQILKQLILWARGDTEQALAAYNGGRGGNVTRPFRNAAYAAKVLETVGRIA